MFGGLGLPFPKKASMVVCLLRGTVAGGNFLFCGSILNDDASLTAS